MEMFYMHLRQFQMNPYLLNKKLMPTSSRGSFKMNYSGSVSCVVQDRHLKLFETKDARNHFEKSETDESD